MKQRRTQIISRNPDPETVDGTAPAGQDPKRDENLADLLNEARILLPGTQVFAAFLITLPFTQRFADLTPTERMLYLVTFVSMLLALICFVTPAAYHRLARPIHQKPAFKVFASWVLILGLVPFSVGTVLVAYLIPSLVMGTTVGIAVATLAGCTLALLWWLFPAIRLHDLVRNPPD